MRDAIIDKNMDRKENQENARALPDYYKRGPLVLLKNSQRFSEESILLLL